MEIVCYVSECICGLFITQLVLTGKFVLREEGHSMRDVWRFVETSGGAQFVITVGPMLMPQWFADTLDTQDSVMTTQIH